MAQAGQSRLGLQLQLRCHQARNLGVLAGQALGLFPVVCSFSVPLCLDLLAVSHRQRTASCSPLLTQSAEWLPSC